MRAAIIEQFNQPWVLKEQPNPSPGPGQVLIRVRYSGLCGTDVHVHHGYVPLEPPFVAGHEPVGDIVAIGEGVTDLRVGDRVGVVWHQKGCGRCDACQGGEIWRCTAVQTWMNLGGGNTELMLAWASGCMLLPDGLDLALAAPLFCAGFTVMSAFRNASLRSGERVTVLGVGGLGHLAIQISKALGHETLAITSRREKEAELRLLGADVVVVSSDDPGQALHSAGGTDVLIATTNSAKHVGQTLAGLKPRGRLVNTGALDGALALDAMSLTFQQLEVRGSTQDERSDLVELLKLASTGKVKPWIEVYPLDEVNAARERLEAGKVRYRAVLELSKS